MSETYLIEAVGDPREWSNDYGAFLAYPLTLEGVVGPKEWSRKSNSRAPSPGERIVGDISGDKIKVDLNATKELGGGGGTSSSGSKNFGGGKREWKPESQYDPEKTARIGRSHAQEMALRYLTLSGFEADPENRQVAAEQIVKPLIDWFEADVNKAATKAAQGAGHNGSPPPAGPPAPAQDKLEAQSRAENLTRLLESAGFNPVAAIFVQQYIESEFSDDQRESAERSLEDPERVQWAVQKLTEGAEHWKGEPLPTTVQDEDPIPF